MPAATGQKQAEQEAEREAAWEAERQQYRAAEEERVEKMARLAGEVRAADAKQAQARVQEQALETARALAQLQQQPKNLPAPAL